MKNLLCSFAILIAPRILRYNPIQGTYSIRGWGKIK